MSKAQDQAHDALASLSKEEKKYVLCRSYPLFGAYYFGLTMEDFMADMVKHSEEHRRSLAMVPAGHCKSSTFAKYNIIRHICWNPNIRIILTTSVFEDASRYCQSIEAELTDNILLKEDFGEFYGPKNWTNSQLIVKQRQHNDPHPTLAVFGSGGATPTWTQKGHGCDVVVVDDVVTDDSSATPEARRKQLSWFRMAVQTGPRPMWEIDRRYGLMVPKGIDWPADAPYNPRPDDDRYGMVIVVGTPFHPKDLYWSLQDDDSYHTLHLDCWTDTEETKPLWPGFWTNESLHAERESLKPVNFNKRYRCSPMDESEMTFLQEWFMGDESHPGCLDRTRSFGQLPKDDDGQELDLFEALGFDPASGLATRFAAFPTFLLNSIVKGGDPGKDTRYVIDAYRAQVGVEWLLDIMLDGNPQIPHPGFYRKYGFDVCKVEKNGFTNLMLTHHRISEAKRKGIRIETHETGRNKLDPISGVKSMEAIFRDGLVSIPYKTDRDQMQAKEIIDQFIYFSFDRSGRRKSLTDYTMAFWFSELAIRAANQRSQSGRNPRHPGYTIKNPYYANRSSDRPVARRVG